MKIETPTLSLSDTVVLLRVKLGPLRAWYPFLADNIRGQQDIHGHQLLPCARHRSRYGKGRSYQPVYALPDVMRFIENVIADEPEAGKVPIKPTVLLIDRSLSWRLNKFDTDCAPITSLTESLAKLH